jgi:hypothetical protein
VKRRVAIAAAIARRPGVGGHTWVALQWMLGFCSLGWEPLLIDWVDDFDAPESRSAVAALAATMARLDLDWVVLGPDGAASAGMSARELDRRLDASELLLNVMGYLGPGVAARFPMRVFLDIDPGFGQMWKALGLADVLAGHDCFASVGVNVGGSGCGVPDLGLPWVPTLPPVALDHWPPAPGGRDVTSVVSWRGPFAPVDFDGRRYGLRVHEFRRFLGLPKRTTAHFRLVLDIEPADEADRARLAAHGWDLRSLHDVADPFAYRNFIQGSAAELCVAKQMYVATRGGWFSDRSACYMASGKPVVAQDTGFTTVLPVGEGLLAFTGLVDAAEGVEAVLADHGRHARAARALAEEHFAAQRVVARLLDRIGAA